MSNVDTDSAHDNCNGNYDNSPINDYGSRERLDDDNDGNENENGHDQNVVNDIVQEVKVTGTAVVGERTATDTEADTDTHNNPVDNTNTSNSNAISSDSGNVTVNDTTTKNNSTIHRVTSMNKVSWLDDPSGRSQQSYQSKTSKLRVTRSGDDTQTSTTSRSNNNSYIDKDESGSSKTRPILASMSVRNLVRQKSMSNVSVVREMSDEHIRRIDIAKSVTNKVILPWSRKYKFWWTFAAWMSIMTAFFETYEIAFSETPGEISLGSPHGSFSATFSIVFYIVFILDIVISFNLAYFNERDDLMKDRHDIARHYVMETKLFWVDLIGVFPFFPIALAMAGQVNQNTDLARYLSLIRLIRLVRLYRVYEVFEVVQYNTHISLSTVTLVRDFGFAILWSHFAACTIFFISRFYDFQDDITWIGSQALDMPEFDRYILALYWSTVTFCTVGYGDYSPANSSEQIFGIIYMLTNMAIGAWIIGSITLLMLKKDEATSQFRDALHSLDQYSKMHGFERRFRKRLLSQAKLFFKHQQISDEEILRNLPLSVRRKVLRRLYLPSLLQTSLLKGLRQQFVDSILISCTVEIFNAGEEILARGHASNDLYLVVEGHVKVMDAFSQDTDEKKSDDNAPFDDTSFHNTSIADDDTAALGIKGFRKLGPGHFINDVSFLTETPSTSTVRTLTVCKTLTLCQSSYKKIAQEHPGSVEKVLRNLLQKAEEVAEEVGENDICLAKRLMVLKSESIRDFKRSKQDDDNENDDADADVTDLHKCVASIQAKAAVVACNDLIKIHIEKMHDDHTTRFLFAAARGNSVTIAMMCDQGLDPNVADYDRRTALMVASMKGNVDAVKKLLEYDADPNLADASGTTALMEATTNGHEHIMDMLMEHGATLGLNASCAAGRMCQAVFDGDMVTLRRLLKAKINPDAGDYDKRTAVHIAAAEGNLAALKLLEQFGANLLARDRWGNTAMDEAQRVKAQYVVDFLLETTPAFRNAGNE